MSPNSELPSGSPATFGDASDDPAVNAAAAEWFARRDGGLSLAEQRALQRWLAVDPRHGRALERLDSAWSAFGKLVRTGGTNEVLDELATRAMRRRRRCAGFAVAASIALLVSGAFWRLSRHDELRMPLPATAAMLVPAQQVLPDGTVVALKDGAQIAVAFTDAVRRVELKRGEAHFEVATNPARPFVVGVGGIEVRAVGTAFSVQLGATAVEVLVTEGAVAVDEGQARVGTAAGGGEEGRGAAAQESRDAGREQRASDGGNEPTPIFAPLSSGLVVEAGKRIVVEIAPNAAAARVTPIDATELGGRLAWRSPRVEFSGAPLAEAIALLNREAGSRSNDRLVIADRALESMRVSGIFRTDNMDAFVLLLEAGFGVDVRRSGRTITLRKADASSKTN